MITRDTDDPFGIRVERLELVVVERPVGDVGTVDRAVFRSETEVDLTQTRQLPIGVVSGTPEGRRHVVALAREEPVAVGHAAAVRARLEQWIRTEEVPAAELDLVARDVAQRRERRFQREQMVAPLLEEAHGLPRVGERLGRGRAARPGPDDDDVELRHPSPPRHSIRAVARRRRIRWRASR